MMKLKQNFGYTKIATEEQYDKDIFCAYCEGRSALWRAFLGWRETDHKKMTFWIPTKKIKNLFKNT